MMSRPGLSQVAVIVEIAAGALDGSEGDPGR